MWLVRTTLQATHAHFMTRETKLNELTNQMTTDTVYNTELADDKVLEYPKLTACNHQHLIANEILKIICYYYIHLSILYRHSTYHW